MNIIKLYIINIDNNNYNALLVLIIISLIIVHFPLYLSYYTTVYIIIFNYTINNIITSVSYNVIVSFNVKRNYYYF